MDEFMRQLLGGGKMISVNPQAPHEFGLIAFPLDEQGDAIIVNPELVVVHEDWDTFLELCKEYVE